MTLGLLTSLCSKLIRGRNSGVNVWQKNCPVCQKPLEKKHPAETIPCPCGKYVWKG
jgi:hypothetical protein